MKERGRREGEREDTLVTLPTERVVKRDNKNAGGPFGGGRAYTFIKEGTIRELRWALVS